MIETIIGAAIPAVGSLLGGLFGSRSSESAGNKNAELQKQFAQKGVRWRVADAKAAGIHPLAALGASLPAAAPTYVGSSGEWMHDAGQDISRALLASKTQAERRAANDFQQQYNAAQLENMHLQNDLLKQRINNAQLPPPMPPQVSSFPVAPGDVHTATLTADSVGPMTTKVVPAEVESSGAYPGVTAGDRQMYSQFTSPDYGAWNLHSKDASQALEELDALRYYGLYEQNRGKVQNVLRSEFWNLIGGKPGWVQALEKKTGKSMYQVRKGYWKFVDDAYELR